MYKMQERRQLAEKKMLREVSITEERNYSSIDLHSIKGRILREFFQWKHRKKLVIHWVIR